MYHDYVRGRTDSGRGNHNAEALKHSCCGQEADGRGFPGGAVVKNPPAKAGDTGSSPGLRRSHMPWNN